MNNNLTIIKKINKSIILYKHHYLRILLILILFCNCSNTNQVLQMEPNSSNQIYNTNSKLNLNKNINSKNIVRSCASCGKQDCILRCPCKLVYYCNEDCQKNHWKEHKKIKEHNTKKRKPKTKVSKKLTANNKNRCICGVLCDVKKLEKVKNPFYCFFCPTIYCSFRCFITNLDDHKEKCPITKDRLDNSEYGELMDLMRHCTNVFKKSRPNYIYDNDGILLEKVTSIVFPQKHNFDYYKIKIKPSDWERLDLTKIPFYYNLGYIMKKNKEYKKNDEIFNEIFNEKYLSKNEKEIYSSRYLQNLKFIFKRNTSIVFKTLFGVDTSKLNILNNKNISFNGIIDIIFKYCGFNTDNIKLNEIDYSFFDKRNKNLDYCPKETLDDIKSLLKKNYGNEDEYFNNNKYVFFKKNGCVLAIKLYPKKLFALELIVSYDVNNSKVRFDELVCGYQNNPFMFPPLPEGRIICRDNYVRCNRDKLKNPFLKYKKQ